MQILLTNDDGYTSHGITLLAENLRKHGHKVFLVAPDKNRSGCSHSIEFLNGPIRLNKIDDYSWSCSGTPVDCVIVSMLGGVFDFDNDDKPDLILSGINAGANLGTDITYSGTAAAARQGSFFGIPSIALSLIENKGSWFWEPVIEYITDNIEVFKSHWKPGIFVNINFPNIGKKPISLVPVFPSMRYYNDRIVTFQAPEGGFDNGTYCFAKPGKTTWGYNNETGNQPQEGSDWAEVRKGNAALSLILSQPQVLSESGKSQRD